MAVESRPLEICRPYGFRHKRAPGTPLVKVRHVDKAGLKGKYGYPTRCTWRPSG